MLGALRSAWAPVLAIALMMLGSGYFTSFVSLHMEALGHPDTLIGWVASSYYVGFLFSSAFVAGLVSRIGHKRAFALFSATLTASILLQGMFESPYAWMGLRALAGTSTAALYVVIESWLLLVFPDGARAAALALYLIALYVAHAACQFFLDIYSPLATEPFMLAAGLCVLAVFPISFTKQEVSSLAGHESQSGFALLRTSPLGVMACALSGFMMSGIYAFGPLFAGDHDLKPSLFMAVTIMGGFVLQWPVGAFGDRFGRKQMLAASSALCAVLAALVILLIHVQASPYTLLPCTFLIGGIILCLYPLGIALACETLPASKLTAASGLLLLSYSAGSILGPITTPYIGLLLPVEPTFLLIVLVSAGLGLWSFLSSKQTADTGQNK